MADDMTVAQTVAVTIEDQPSRSKGWSRYSLSSAHGPVVRSRTGNAWVSADHAGEVAPGTALTLTAQVMLRVGKFPRQREEVSKREYRLIAEPGSVAEIRYEPGSQGLWLRIDGARVVEG